MGEYPQRGNGLKTHGNGGGAGVTVVCTGCIPLTTILGDNRGVIREGAKEGQFPPYRLSLGSGED